MQKRYCIMAIDEGRKRVGIALTDEDGQIAFPYKTVARNRALNIIIPIINEKNIARIVIGLPFNTDGSRGYRFEETVAFAKSIIKRVKIPILGIDERYSTEEAKELIRNYPGKESYEIDAIEAFIILNRYLNNEKTYPI